MSDNKLSAIEVAGTMVHVIMNRVTEQTKNLRYWLDVFWHRHVKDIKGYSTSIIHPRDEPDRKTCLLLHLQ